MKEFLKKLSFKDRMIVKLLLRNNGYKIKNNELNYIKIDFIQEDGTIVEYNEVSDTRAHINKQILKYLSKNLELFKDLILNIKTNPKNDMESFWTDLVYKCEGATEIINGQTIYEELFIKALEKYPEIIPKTLHLFKHFGQYFQKKLIETLIKSNYQNNLTIENIDKLLEVFKQNNIFIQNALIQTIEVVKKENAPEEILNYLLEKLQEDYIFSITSYHSELTKAQKQLTFKAFNQFIKMYTKGIITAEELQNITSTPKTMLSAYRLGTTDLYYLGTEQIININVKDIRQINKQFQQHFPNENIGQHILVNMYIIFGKQPTLDIIAGKYGKIEVSLLESFADLYQFYHEEKNMLRKYTISNTNGSIEYTETQKKLITFLFASGPNDPNANIKKIISGELNNSQLPIARLITEWEEISQNLKNNVTLPMVIKILSENIRTLAPDEKEIETTLKFAGEVFYEYIADTYKKMQTRISSSIPKVKGTLENLEYEILDLNDPTQMNVGYITNCCFTFGGTSNRSLEHACTSENGRIFVVKKDGEIIAQSWVWRIGNVLCFDNIETVGLTRRNDKDIWNAYQKAATEIIAISEKNEPKPIQLITVGTKYSKIKLPGRKLSDDQILLPIDKNTALYTDAREQIIVATSPNYTKSESFEATPIYQDERKKIKIIDPQIDNKEALHQTEEVINKITYASLSPNDKKHFESYLIQDFTLILHGSDWFLGITTDGEIIQKSSSHDPRHKEEIKKSLLVINQKLKTGEINSFINDNENFETSNDKDKANV